MGLGREVSGTIWCNRFGGRKSSDLFRAPEGISKDISHKDCLSSTLVVSLSGKNRKCLYQGIRQTELQLQYCHVLLGGAKQVAPSLSITSGSVPCPPKLIVGDSLVQWCRGMWVLPLASSCFPSPNLFLFQKNGDNDGVPISWLCYKDEKECHM